MATIIRFGLDLTKNSFVACDMDAAERIKLRKALSRGELLIFFFATTARDRGDGIRIGRASLGAVLGYLLPRHTSPSSPLSQPDSCSMR